jgi:hypothetical protein
VPTSELNEMIASNGSAFQPLPMVHAKTFDSAGLDNSPSKSGLSKRLLPLSMPLKRSGKSKTMDAIVSPTSFQQLPLQKFDTIEANHGANLSYRMNKKQEEQEHYTIHAFDRDGKNIVNKFANLRSPVTERAPSVLSIWPSATSVDGAPSSAEGKKPKRASFSLRKK